MIVHLCFSGVTGVILFRQRHYLKTFDRLLVLRHFGLPRKFMVQVTGHSLSLIEEHLAIADKHFPTPGALTQYLTSREVDLKDAGETVIYACLPGLRTLHHYGL